MRLVPLVLVPAAAPTRICPGAYYAAWQALTAAAKALPDIVVLNLGLPDMDGIDVIRGLRGWTAVPIIILSGRSQSAAKVDALDAGADDYVTKPFNIEELLARLRAVTRRVPVGHEAPCVRIGDCLVDLQAHRVTSAAATDGQHPPADLHLTPTEWPLLEQLIRSPGKLVSQRELLLAIWGPKYVEETHYLRQYMAQLRRKLDPTPHAPATCSPSWTWATGTSREGAHYGKQVR